jgi:hypothetical protein
MASRADGGTARSGQIADVDRRRRRVATHRPCCDRTFRAVGASGRGTPGPLAGEPDRASGHRRRPLDRGPQSPRRDALRRLAMRGRTAATIAPVAGHGRRVAPARRAGSPDAHCSRRRHGAERRSALLQPPRRPLCGRIDRRRLHRRCREAARLNTLVSPAYAERERTSSADVHVPRSTPTRSAARPHHTMMIRFSHSTSMTVVAICFEPHADRCAVGSLDPHHFVVGTDPYEVTLCVARTGTAK